MKKLLTIVLAVVMIFSLSSVVFAGEAGRIGDRPESQGQGHDKPFRHLGGAAAADSCAAVPCRRAQMEGRRRRRADARHPRTAAGIGPPDRAE